jgi:hypothetical protein
MSFSNKGQILKTWENSAMAHFLRSSTNQTVVSAFPVSDKVLRRSCSIETLSITPTHSQLVWYSPKGPQPPPEVA